MCPSHPTWIFFCREFWVNHSQSNCWRSIMWHAFENDAQNNFSTFWIWDYETTYLIVLAIRPQLTCLFKPNPDFETNFLISWRSISVDLSWKNTASWINIPLHCMTRPMPCNITQHVQIQITKYSKVIHTACKSRLMPSNVEIFIH